MDEFRMKIKRRIIGYTVMTLIAVILGVYGYITIDKSGDGSMTDGIVAGFQFGIILGIGLMALVQIIKLSTIMKSDLKLKMLYNQEHDERLKSIRSKAGMPMLMITSVLMLIAAIIAGYINIIVFYTLVIAAVIQLSAGAIVKLYCMKTM